MSRQELALAVDEAENLRHFSRTPRPYAHDGEEVKDWQRQRQSGNHSLAGSESGTEADDERPSFIKALPSSTLRPRKGLKTGEQDEDALLTPSQLDEQERRVQGYFLRQRKSSLGTTDLASSATEQEEKVEQEKVLRRRFAEFVRRISEVGLMGFILVCVLCGRGVGRTAWAWRRELLSHLSLIILLILAYPIKLSIVDTQARRTKLWQRFRVPASFDPATVLYPPLLPVLVALSVAPANPAVIMPNLILGLASLPQRLFPRSSRLGGLNAMHWLISIIPLIITQNTAWPARLSTASLRNELLTGLSPETLVSLYPLHHALLQPLQYLTTTSLLVSELHLLSVSLINLLLLAKSPQANILKACLWIGGVSLLVFCAPILHWNVTLARVPRWKLRRPGHTAEERKSLVDAVSDLISAQRATSAFNAAQSDADEDEAPAVSFKESTETIKSIGLNTAGLVFPAFSNTAEPQSALEPRPNHSMDMIPNQPQKRPRSNTVPVGDHTASYNRPSRKHRPSSLLWCLQLTPDQAQRRKWLYAGFIYSTVVAVILVPVRVYISQKALHNQEPIGWALSYLFGSLPFFRPMIQTLHLQFWIPLPTSVSTPFVLFGTPLEPPSLRLAVLSHWATILTLGLALILTLPASVEVDTRRKVFHGIMVLMLLPTTFLDPCFVALALALVLAIFLLLEVIRGGQVAPLGPWISRFVAPYVDGRDLRGPVVVSHIFLLVGCAVPLWLSLASSASNGWAADGEMGMISGVVCVGMGDAAASLIGRRYGRRKWIWVGGKSLEGSAGFVGAVWVGLVAGKVWEVWLTGQGRLGVLGWVIVALKALVCGCGASFMEAVLTGANDNVVVPVALWLLVKGVRL